MGTALITDNADLEELSEANERPTASYLDGSIHPNYKLLSHSSNKLLHSCARKFQLYKLLKVAKSTNVDFDFGHLVGFGTQNYLVHRNLEKAYYEMFWNWKNHLDDDEGKGKKKTFWHALIACDRFVDITNGPLANYRVVHFPHPVSGELLPANELGFIIDCGDGFTVRGKLDSLLEHVITGQLACYEGKTSKSVAHEAQYKNSGQTLGYSLILDSVARLLGRQQEDAFEVKTVIYQTASMEWEIFSFKKSHTQRALWIKSILLDIKHIAEYVEEEYFPMNGESCYDFFRPCEYFNLCEMNTEYLTGGPMVEIKQDDLSQYTFKFTLDEIIQAQLEKMG